MHWDLLVGLVVGLVALVTGIAIRLGYLRPWAEVYFAGGVPLFRRHAPLAFMPIGCFFIGGMVLGLMADAGRAWAPLIVLVLVMTIGAAGLLLWTLWRPPLWLKPGWIRAREAAAGARAPKRTGSRARDS